MIVSWYIYTYLLFFPIKDKDRLLWCSSWKYAKIDRYWSYSWFWNILPISDITLKWATSSKRNFHIIFHICISSVLKHSPINWSRKIELANTHTYRNFILSFLYKYSFYLQIKTAEQNDMNAKIRWDILFPWLKYLIIYKIKSIWV